MKGCNCACSYCIVPSVRGKEVCRPPDEIIEEIAQLAQNGAQEVTLLGQTVNSYRFSHHESRVSSLVSFPHLIHRIAEETEITRIRFASPHPKDVRDELIEQYRTNHKLMPHIHLPVQSGSNDTLQRMRRGYTRERYLDICEKLRATRPGFAISTDLIVGFCGETEEDFEETLDLMRQVDFDSCFAFKYSPRAGTKSAREFEDDVPEKEKAKRLEALLTLQRETTRRRNEALVGTRIDVLVERENRRDAESLSGRAPDNRIVHFPGNPDLIGSIVPVRITQAHDNSVRGEVLT